MAKLEEVFGVSSKHVESYLEREGVDAKFREAIETDKQVVVYGSSKQGKTSLVSKYLPYEENILVSLTPRTTVLDIYQTILSSVGVRIVAGTTEARSTESSLGIAARFKALIPLFSTGEAEVKGEINAGSSKETRYDEVPVNLELPQHVSELLKRVRNRKKVILENFHYLNDDIQKQLAFDLRAYQELGVKFVILGVWREKNRMAQFNGDLLDRIVEIPVEPWLEDEFREVAAKGAAALRISFERTLLEKAINASFSSIGVFQELMKGVCRESGVSETLADVFELSNAEALEKTIDQKARDYAARHQRALEAIAAGHTSGGAKGDLPPLFLPYYLVKVVIEGGFEAIKDGTSRKDLHDRIRAAHHRGDDVRASDMSNLLFGLANLQAAKSISPPIIDFDAQNRVLQVVDSTFYFFLKHSDPGNVMETIQNPLGSG